MTMKYPGTWLLGEENRSNSHALGGSGQCEGSAASIAGVRPVVDPN